MYYHVESAICPVVPYGRKVVGEALCPPACCYHKPRGSTNPKDSLKRKESALQSQRKDLDLFDAGEDAD